MNLETKQLKLGAGADHPGEMGWTAWRAILGRIWINSGRCNLSLMAAGVAFFAFLSFVPLLGALLMAYGIFADPAIVAKHMSKSGSD
jgi:membrane protein